MTDSSSITIEIPASMRGPLWQAARDAADAHVANAARIQVESEHCPADLVADDPTRQWDGGIYITPEKADEMIAAVKALWIDAETVADALRCKPAGYSTSESHWQDLLRNALFDARASFARKTKGWQTADDQ